jgi:hypothetical protein
MLIQAVLNNEGGKPSMSRNHDLAFGKKYYLSDSIGQTPHIGIVKESERFFFHTSFASTPSITIDLADIYELRELVICNRKDSHHDRARSLFYIVHPERDFSVKDSLPIVIPDSFLGPECGLSVTPLFNMPGRYIGLPEKASSRPIRQRAKLGRAGACLFMRG